jgi:ubiquinone/menaquinone biosynthesis C-methylase UbiE
MHLTLPPVDFTSKAQAEFNAAARAAGYDPNNKWIGGYAQYEWDHLRRLLDAYGLDLKDKKILEFGCNVGASTVVLAALGAEVTAVDVAEDMIRIARANIDRHGVQADIYYVPDTRQLPFDAGQFDFILANSVLEYVTPDHLPRIINEFHRVSAPQAQMLICGTASRLSPKEVHSGRWFVNYMPRFMDPVLYGKANAQRGLSPLHLARALKPHFKDVTGAGWGRGRIAIHGALSLPVRVVVKLAAFLAISPGWLSPNMEMLLQRLDEK